MGEIFVRSLLMANSFSSDFVNTPLSTKMTANKQKKEMTIKNISILINMYPTMSRRPASLSVPQSTLNSKTDKYLKQVNKNEPCATQKTNGLLKK